MPGRMTEKIAFLTGEIAGLKSRIGSSGNSVQAHKLDMLEDIKSDYEQSVSKALERRESAA